jgi:hypothetical protein
MIVKQLFQFSTVFYFSHNNSTHNVDEMATLQIKVKREMVNESSGSQMSKELRICGFFGKNLF